MATAQPGSSSGKGQEADPGASVGGERLDWMVQHPKYTEMMALDVSDSTQVYAAFLVYLDLLEARNWKDVTCRGSAELQLVYLLGFPAEQEKVHVVVPMPVHMTLSHARIRRIMESTCNQSEQQALFIILAIVDSDSTVVYYRLTDGFVVPDPPDVTEDMDNRKLRKRPKFHR